MKAVQINAYGGVEVFELNENAPKPLVKPGMVLVEVSSASINPIDWKVRAGFLKEMAPLSFPVTMGGDFSGVVLEVEDNTTNLKAGDQVFGDAIVLDGGSSGSFAEFLIVKTTHIAKKPNNLSLEEASALPLVGTSAIQALEDHIKLKGGQKILIHGGAGRIGSIAIQIAKSLGAYVATTVGTKDIDLVKSLGADEVIDYKTQKFEELLKDFDAVFDTAGGETIDKSFLVLKKGGILVSMAGQPNKELAEKYGVTGIAQYTEPTTDRLNRLTKLVESGKVKVHIDKTFPLEDAKAAFTYFEQSHPKGKVVLKIKHD